MTNLEKYLEENKTALAPWLENGEQGRIDIKILPHLKHIENGCFVEAGALDGLFMSNTSTLENLGWNGVLIEPSLEACRLCVKNRKVPVVCGALVSKNYKESVIAGDFFYDGDMGKGAWSSINRNKHALDKRVYVPAVTLKRVLQAWNIKKVDLLSLDVEGYEMNALKGLDFDEVDVRYILVEINFGDYDLEDMDNFLGERGFKNLGCMSNFSKETNEGWDGSHQDYLYGKSI